MTLPARDVSIGTLLLPRERDDVGEVVLAARVAVVDRLEPAREMLRRRRHHAGVDLADRALLRRRVLVLDDRLHRALGVADDAPVTGRVVELDRQQRKRALPRMPDDRCERLRPRERVGAERARASRRRRTTAAAPAQARARCRAADPAAPSEDRPRETAGAPRRRHDRRRRRCDPARACAPSRARERAAAGRPADAAPWADRSACACRRRRQGSRY